MTVMLSPDQRDRLIKMLRLMSSDQIGERATAAAMASRVVREAGLDWDNLISCVPAPAARHQRPSTSPMQAWARTLTFLLQRPQYLNDWEQTFLRSAATRSRLTEKQAAVFVQIYERVVAMERKA